MIPARSWLFTPGTRPDRFDRAVAAGADRLIIDLEDAVVPERKEAARSATLAYLLQADQPTGAIAVRINALDTPHGLEDLTTLVRNGAAPGHILLPKTESPDLVALVGRLLAGRPATRLAALIETAAGLENAAAIARASPSLDLLMFGAADMAADLGADGSWESLLYARSRIVAAAKSAGIMAVDSPWFAIEDLAGLDRAVTRAQALGFDAKAAIHPRHVAAINRTFTPTPEMIDQARQIIGAVETGIGRMGDGMIDEAMARRARRVLDLAGQSTTPIRG